MLNPPATLQPGDAIDVDDVNCESGYFNDRSIGSRMPPAQREVDVEVVVVAYPHGASEEAAPHRAKRAPGGGLEDASGVLRRQDDSLDAHATAPCLCVDRLDEARNAVEVDQLVTPPALRIELVAVAIAVAEPAAPG